MKICLINNLYQPFNRGGAEKVCETIARGLIKAGHKVVIITTKPRKQLSIKNYELRIYYLSSLYYNLNKLPKFFRFFWHCWNLFNLVGYFKIKKILKKEKCGAVITNNLMGPGFLTPLAIKNLKIKHLHIAHDIQLIHPSGLMYYGRERVVDSFFAKIYLNICRALFKSPSVVIFPSAWLKNFYLKRNFFSRSKIMVLPNPIAMAVARTGGGGGGFKFLFLGQLEKHKGVFLLIEAFNKISRQYPQVELWLAGEGRELNNLKFKILNLKLERNIKFLGWPGDEPADKLLSSSHSLVYPSLVYENCPNAIERALAAGLPVLASDLGGIAELLSDDTGVLFKPADTDNLAERMSWLVENKNSLAGLGRAGRRRAENFKVENYVKRLEELIISHT